MNTDERERAIGSVVDENMVGSAVYEKSKISFSFLDENNGDSGSTVDKNIGDSGSPVDENSVVCGSTIDERCDDSGDTEQNSGVAEMEPHGMSPKTTSHRATTMVR